MCRVGAGVGSDPGRRRGLAGIADQGSSEFEQRGSFWRPCAREKLTSLGDPNVDDTGLLSSSWARRPVVGDGRDYGDSRLSLCGAGRSAAGPTAAPVGSARSCRAVRLPRWRRVRGLRRDRRVARNKRVPDLPAPRVLRAASHPSGCAARRYLLVSLRHPGPDAGRRPAARPNGAEAAAMSAAADFPRLLARFFSNHVMQQRQASPHTIASYRDTFRLLVRYAQRELNKSRLRNWRSKTSTPRPSATSSAISRTSAATMRVPATSAWRRSAMLKAWLKERRGEPDDPVFPNQRGRALSQKAVASPPQRPRRGA